MAKNFPYLMIEKDIQVQEAQRVPNKMSPKRTTPRLIIIKMLKVKDSLKSSKRKTVTYKRAPIKLSADLSTETVWDRRTGIKYSK